MAWAVSGSSSGLPKLRSGAEDRAEPPTRNRVRDRLNSRVDPSRLAGPRAAQLRSAASSLMATSTPNTILMTWLIAAGVPRPRYRRGTAAIRLRADGRVPARVEHEAEQAAQPGQHFVGHAAGVEQRRVTLDGTVGVVEGGVEQRQEPLGEVRRSRILGVDGGQLAGAGDPREVQPDAVHDRGGRAVTG